MDAGAFSDLPSWMTGPVYAGLFVLTIVGGWAARNAGLAKSNPRSQRQVVIESASLADTSVFHNIDDNVRALRTEIRELIEIIKEALEERREAEDRKATIAEAYRRGQQDAVAERASKARHQIRRTTKNPP